MPDLKDRIAVALGEHYELGAELGRGGMAIVYRAEDRRLRRPVAVKVLPPELAFNADVRTRFLREAQTSAQLAHPNIVPIYNVDERDGVVYFIMGFVDGETVGGRLRREKQMDPETVRRIMAEVAGALSYAHGHGVVHRDIKPDNILLERATGRALVTDFGIARAAAEDSRLTVTGIAVGTPAYMSPEQAMGEREVDGRSDLYSLAIVGYQMLAGEPPFRAANTPAMLMKHLVEPPQPLRERAAGVPPELAAAIHHALAKRPEDRWSDANAFRNALLDTSARVPEQPRGRAPVIPPAPREEQWWPASAPAAPMAPMAPRLPELRPLSPGRPSREKRPDPLRDLRAKGPLSSVVSLSRAEEDLIADRIFDFRKQFFGSAATLTFLVFINAMTQTPPWVIFPAIGLGFGVIKRWSPLGRLGLKMWDVILEGEDAIVLARNRKDGSRIQRLADTLKRRFKQTLVYSGLAMVTGFIGGTFNYEPLIPVLAVSMFGGALSLLGTGLTAFKLKRSGVGIGEAVSGDWQPREGFLDERPVAKRVPLKPSIESETERLVGREVALGPYGESVRRAVQSRRDIAEVVATLGENEQEMIPDVVPTVESLAQRVIALAQTVHRLRSDVSSEAIAKLDARLTGMTGGPEDPQRERTRILLERQRASLVDLLQRREQMETQLESAVLMLENLRLDLAKLRSSGFSATADELGNATQEARALSRELEYALAGIRESKSP